MADAKEIIDLCEHYNVPILVDYTRRFIPELIDLKKRYDSGEFGSFMHGITAFNRGTTHTLSHAIDFLNFLEINPLRNNNFFEFDNVKDYRIWSIDLFFEKFHWSERRIGDMPVPDCYDHHTRYVVDNAYNFLEGKEELRCTAEDGLRALEIMEGLCK